MTASTSLRLSNYQGNIVCSINSSDGAFDTKDDGLNGRYDPHNGDNVSHKFFGFPGGWVTVSCTSSTAPTRSPGTRGAADVTRPRARRT